MHRAHGLQERIAAAYARYDFAEVVQALGNFCSVDLGSLYLDVTKDRLYTMPEDSQGRRSAQSAMYRISEAFVRWIAPILAYTADEMWRHLPPAAEGEREGNVLFATWYEGLAPLGDKDGDLTTADFDRLLALREQVSRVLEPMRASGDIGAALEAEIHVACGPGADLARLAPLAPELRFLLISGDVTVAPGEADGLHVTAHRTDKPKCIRCWHHQASVGGIAAHPHLCARCVDNIEGPGEDRRWF